jgi:tetratricopeptide (TPR) repeat protein
MAATGNRSVNVEIDRLLELVAEVPPERRAAVLARECTDAALQAEVESLLAYAGDAESYFENAIQGVALSLHFEHEPSAGDTIGSYRILSLIGRGGMGSVYLAERSDGEIQHRVAVKFLRADGHRPEWRERFLRERQLLASLHHPSIVHVIDAGHTGDGQPYLVMEHVDGVPIDRYAAEIGVRERLNLFLRVCEGVSHAHRHLIIHRDLKPSNILVDGAGQPKLLDFGIAKLLDESGDLTRTAEQLMTPDYASPEQLRGEAQSTATDVYSLGAVLYKLLTGTSPRENARGEPQGHMTAASRVNPEAPRDLDYVVAKALRPEPEERYGSADELASDVGAVLARRPVAARGGDSWYRTRRLLRRYWMPVAVGVMVMASLAAGLYVANRERLVALRQFAEAQRLAGKLFDIEEQAARLPGGTRVRQSIVDTTLEYLRRMTTNVPMSPALALELGTAYMRVARVQRVGVEIDQADSTEQKAQTLVDSVLAADPINRMALLRSAQIAQDRMLIARHRYPDDALRFAGKAAQRLDQFFHTGDVDTNGERENAQEVILVQLNVANEYIRAERFEDAIAMCRRTIDIARSTNWPAYIGGALLNLAKASRARGDLEGALQASNESVQALNPPPAQSSPGRLFALISALINQGQILAETESINLGRTQEAVVALQRAATIAEELAKKDPGEFDSRQRIFSSEVTLANILRDTDPRDALNKYDHVLKRLSEVRENDGVRLCKAETLAASAYPLRSLGRDDEARKRLDTAFQHLSQLKLYPAEKIILGSEVADAVHALADFQAGTGNLSLAGETYQKLLGEIQASKPKPETSLTDAARLSAIYRAAAAVHRRAGLPERAATLEQRDRDLWQDWDRALPNNSFVRRQLETLHRSE